MTCKTCGRVVDESEFPITYSDGKGYRRSTCKKCWNERVKVVKSLMKNKKATT